MDTIAKKLKKKKPKKERQGDADTFEKEPLIRENVDEEQAQQRPPQSKKPRLFLNFCTSR